MTNGLRQHLALLAASAIALAVLGSFVGHEYLSGGLHNSAAVSTRDCTSPQNTCTPTESQMALSPQPVNNSRSGAPMTKSAALSAVQADTTEVERVDRIDAKLTSWGAYESARADTSPHPGFASNQNVWVVAVGGAIKPAFAHGQTYTWGVFVYDAQSGYPLSSAAGLNGVWPPFFDSIADLSA